MFKISSWRVPMLLAIAALVGNAVATSPLLDPPRAAEEPGKFSSDTTAANSPSIEDSASLDRNALRKINGIAQAESGR